MGKSSHFLLALAGFGALAVQSVDAGSAVAMEPRHGNLATAYGGPMQREEERALAEGRRRYGPDVRIIAASDVTGYGAIAVARFGKRAIIGVALGQRSAAEAYTRAIEHCLRAGGTNPKVRWGFRG